MNLITRQYMWQLCQSCAESVYGNRPPSPAYAARVARLLWATGMHESAAFQHTRQIGFGLTGGRGGHGYWQIQSNSALNSMRRLDRNVSLRLNAAQWYFGGADGVAGQAQWYNSTPLSVLMIQIVTDPRLSLLFARLEYMKDPDPAPEKIDEMAEYWGRVYNTRQEASKNAQFAANFRHHCHEIGIKDDKSC